MDFLADLFTSSGLGASLGLVGSWLTKREERRTLEIRLAHEAAMASIRKEEAGFEFEHERAMADKGVERAQIESGTAMGTATLAAFQEGLKEQQMLYGTRWVDALRGLMRPLITVYLLILATLVARTLGAEYGGPGTLDAEFAETLYADTINRIFFLVTTAVTWWFGSRPSSHGPHQNRTF